MLKVIFILKKVFYFYLDGFKNMSIGKTLWVIIIVKLFVMFFVLKLFLFKDFLKTKFDNDTEKANYVLDQIIKK
ncbi:MAG TPA: DUF4492 domain-containing protein [Bacteroidales bacterium]|nr:DUF4492 domain-containing protein [Bacteroidales bacterium]